MSSPSNSDTAPGIHPLSKGDISVLTISLGLPTVATWLYFYIFSGSEFMQAAYGISKVVQFGIPVVWLFLIKKHEFKFAQPTTKGLRTSLFFGLAVVGGMLVLYWGFLKNSAVLENAPAMLWEKIDGMGFSTPGKFIILAAFLSFIHSWLEEYYWRWYAYGQLRRSLSQWAANVISSLGFMSHHVLVLHAYLPGEMFWTATMPLSLCIAVGGGVWAWIYQRSGSLYGPWLSHMLVDIGIMIIGYDLCGAYWK